MSMKGEYQIFKILREACIEGMNRMGITEGFDVRRFAQAHLATGNKLVLLNLVDSERVGWQGHSYRFDVSSGKELRTDEWIDQQNWHFHFIKKMENDDNVDTVTADDMANMMMTWFNGPGVEYLKSRELANLVIDPHSIMVYNDDSDLYQRRVVFPMKIQIPKSFKWEVPDLSVMDVETCPV